MREVLERFKDNVNHNTQIQRVVKDWNTTILLEQRDAPERYLLNIDAGKIEDIADFDGHESVQTRICGNADVMSALFEGKLNAIKANNDGLLEVYGSMNDQVRLDAIALLLWGI